jgi:glycosyltransferase involved in cell wall biosynthesis
MDCSPNYGHAAGKFEINGYTMHPQGGGRSEVETIANFTENNYDILFTLYDVWPLNTLVKEIAQKGIVWIPYIPLDMTFLPHTLGDMLNAATYILPMSGYGVEMLKRAGFTNVGRYIYHGVDTNVYKPITKTKQEMRNWLGFKDKSFIISIFKMNKGCRVKYGENLEAIKIFLQNNPDIASEVGIYIHAAASSPEGTNIQHIAKSLGLEAMIRYVKPYSYLAGYSEEQMAQAYNASDVVLNNVAAGGFEIPIIEAMACGIPVIATDGMAMHELLEPILPELLVPPKAEVWTPMPSKEYQPDVDAIADRLEWVVNHDMAKRNKELARYAHRKFNWNAIIPQWVNFIEFLGGYIDEKCIHPPEQSSQYMRKLSHQGLEL